MARLLNPITILSIAVILAFTASNIAVSSGETNGDNSVPLLFQIALVVIFMCPVLSVASIQNTREQGKAALTRNMYFVVGLSALMLGAWVAAEVSFSNTLEMSGSWRLDYFLSFPCAAIQILALITAIFLSKQ